MLIELCHQLSFTAHGLIVLYCSNTLVLIDVDVSLYNTGRLSVRKQVNYNCM